MLVWNMLFDFKWMAFVIHDALFFARFEKNNNSNYKQLLTENVIYIQFICFTGEHLYPSYNKMFRVIYKRKHYKK